MQLSLVFFTVLSQLAVGLALFYPLAQCAGYTNQPGVSRKIYFAILAILAVALFASVFHLGHPFGAIHTLANLDSSWLSREILFIGLFGAMVLLSWLTQNSAFQWASAVIGIAAICITGMGYAPEAQAAVHNILPLTFFLLTAVALGSIACAYATPSAWGMLRQICLCALVAMLVLYGVVPFIWKSGGTVMQATAQLWLASPFYWLRLIIGLLVPIILLLKNNMTAGKVVFPLILIGELLGRIVFFNTANSATFIGELY